MSLRGGLLKVGSLTERLQLAMDNGAKRVLLPAENKRDFADIPTEVLDKLQIIKQRFDEVSDLIIQPDIISDQQRYVQLNKEYKDLRLLMDKRAEYITLHDNLQEAEEIISDGSDAEMVEMAKMQYEEAKEAIPPLEEEIKYLLIPKDPEDGKNAVMEIRAGTGGDEAGIFAGDLFQALPAISGANAHLGDRLEQGGGIGVPGRLEDVDAGEVVEELAVPVEGEAAPGAHVAVVAEREHEQQHDECVEEDVDEHGIAAEQELRQALRLGGALAHSVPSWSNSLLK